ncbi:RNB domain-containing ribonuclease [Lysinimonas soli]|uniref:RNB domain-containing ribonuclease n=1 Tax=Lysinimonas soli TaxID=1074233 RepID=A0ABW0NNB6_9MICO
MHTTALRLTPLATDNELARLLAALPGELKLERDFPSAVLAEAAAAAGSAPLPDRDATDLELVTLDPIGSADLDQAFQLVREGAGYRFWYAIADVPAFVAPGHLIDAEAHKRGQTMYAPDGRIPLHPTVLSEGAASLLPDQLRGAFVWEFGLDANAAVTSSSLTTARVRSRRRLDYGGVQAAIDGGSADGTLTLLREIGLARLALERARGGASLNLPEVDIDKQNGRYLAIRRAQLPVENWNAQLSLLTGMAAATIMLEGKVGILRTMPPADPESVDRFRHQTRALGAPWPADQPYGEYLAGLDGTNPHHLAILHAAGSLFRGAGYTPFDGTVPADSMQSAVGAPYAHVTAPLRRLVDRFGLVVCEALSSGAPVPDWARSALPQLPAEMSHSSNLAGQLDRRALDAVETAVLAPRVGEIFDGVIIAQNKTGSVVQLADPAVTAECTGHTANGAAVRVRLVTADLDSATLLFEPVA